MRIVGIIQARMGSKRLPGKVMADICGKPLIQYVCERVAKARQLDDWCVAIPNRDCHSKLMNWSENFAAPIVSGAEDDVARRLIDAGTAMHSDYIVRICADSPLIDPAEIDRVAEANFPTSEVVSNTGDNIPHGSIAQCYHLGLLKASYPKMTTEQREHVSGLPTSPIDGPESKYSLTVDTQADLDFIRKVVGKMDRAHWTYDWAACQKIASQL